MYTRKLGDVSSFYQFVRAFVQATVDPQQNLQKIN